MRQVGQLEDRLQEQALEKSAMQELIQRLGASCRAATSDGAQLRRERVR